MTITTITTPRSDGSYTVYSSAVAKNLTGQRIAPPPIGDKGDDAENAVPTSRHRRTLPATPSRTGPSSSPRATRRRCTW